MKAGPGETEAGDRILWVTNIATPYRAPLWAEMGLQASITVALLADQEHNRQWTVPLEESRYRVLRCRARALYRTDDTTFYAPSVPLLRAIRSRPRAVVLDGWESPAYLAVMAMCRALRVPVYASYRSTSGTHRFRVGPVALLRRMFMRSATGVLTAGCASSEAVRGMGVPADRITEGFNTVDVARFAEGAAISRSVASAMDQVGHHFLYVGMLIERKNVDSLIEAFAKAREPMDTLAIVGSGPLRGILEEVASRFGVSESVHFSGHLEGKELTAAYGRAHTFVLPSSAEVWGLVVNEALAAGLHAVVSSAAGIAPELIGMPGVFVADPNPGDLAAAMAKSRSHWAGPITEHPVSQHTPRALAQVVLGMIGVDAP